MHAELHFHYSNARGPIRQLQHFGLITLNTSESRVVHFCRWQAAQVCHSQRSLASICLLALACCSQVGWNSFYQVVTEINLPHANLRGLKLSPQRCLIHGRFQMHVQIVVWANSFTCREGSPLWCSQHSLVLYHHHTFKTTDISAVTLQ